MLMLMLNEMEYCLGYKRLTLIFSFMNSERIWKALLSLFHSFNQCSNGVLYHFIVWKSLGVSERSLVHLVNEYFLKIIKNLVVGS